MLGEYADETGALAYEQGLAACLLHLVQRVTQWSAQLYRKRLRAGDSTSRFVAQLEAARRGGRPAGRLQAVLRSVVHSGLSWRGTCRFYALGRSRPAAPH